MLKSMLWGIKPTRRLSRGLYLCAILGEVCLRLQTLLNLFLSARLIDTLIRQRWQEELTLALVLAAVITPATKYYRRHWFPGPSPDTGPMWDGGKMLWLKTGGKLWECQN